MRLHILSLFLGAMALAGVGCSSSGSGSGASGAASAIDGTWSTSCAATGGNGVPGAVSQKEVLVLSLGSFTDTQTGYSDGACTTPIATVAQSGTFVVSTTTTSVGGITATEWTLVQSSIVATPLTSGEATTLNTSNGGGSVCTGITFTSGTGTSLAGATCGGGGGGSSAMPSNGATLYDVYTLSGSTLTLGSSGNGNVGQVSSYPSSMGNSYTN